MIYHGINLCSIKAIRYTTLANRLQITGLVTQSVDMIAVNTALIYGVANTTNLCHITASKYSFKQGLFFHALDNIKDRIG